MTPQARAATAPRDMDYQDLSRILEIDRAASGSAALSADDYLSYESRHNCRCLVVERDERVVAVMVYAMQRTRFVVRSLVVDPAYQRRGIGRELLESLVARLRRHQRRSVRVVVSEYNTEAQLFLRACGFRVVKVLRGHFGSRDGYLFSIRKGQVA